MDSITIAGRQFDRFDVTRRTVRHDHYMSAVFRRTGLDKITPTAEEAEQPMEYLLRLNAHLRASGHACALLAAFLLPEGTTPREWRPEVARRIQEHLETADTEEDRQLVDQLAFEVMVGFFEKGLRLLMTSLASMNAGENESKPDEKTTKTTAENAAA